MEVKLFFLVFLSASAQLIVQLPEGQIKGHQVKSFTNKSYHAFEGIPFAKPPLGDLRFQAPEPVPSWDGLLETTELKYCCYSVVSDNERENEDCLHLNVFTPILDREVNTTLLPVVFWFYGGGFINGCADWWPQYWMDEDIVVVIPNYRIGPFGFLATDDLAAPGNAGLKDQRLALDWTYKNVHLFGGDNQKITIAGQSAGGSSVGWQLLDPQNAGKFRGAIIESGSPLNTWAFRDSGLTYAVDLALSVNESLPDMTTEQLVVYLQSLEAKQIDVASTVTTGYALPVLEPIHSDAFITEAMYELFDAGNYTKVPMIVGINSEEKITLARDTSALVKYASGADEDLSSLVPKNFNFKPDVTALQVGERIREIYVGDSTLKDNLGRYIRLSSDNQFTRSVIEQGKLMAKYNDVYFYIFSYDGIAGGVNLTFTDADSVAHAEELKYNWGTTPLEDLNESDRTVHDQMMKLWTNFVKNLHPTPYEDPVLQNVIWEKVTEESFHFLNINTTLSLEENPKGNYFIGWTELFEQFAQRPYKTF